MRYGNDDKNVRDKRAGGKMIENVKLAGKYKGTNET